MEKKCSSCKKIRPLSQFSKNKHRADGRAYLCKECCAKLQKRWRGKLTKERKQHDSRKQWLLQMYGLSLEDYAALLHEQNYQCGICKKQFTQTANVDHNHDTGKVRGLLCHNCNSLLGHAKDNPDILTSAIEYLQQSETYCGSKNK